MNILLVDDEPEALRSMELTLKMAGFSNVFCSSHSSGVMAILEEKRIDVAVLDIMMPQLSGIELLKKIKEKDPSGLVIMATGLQDIDTAVRCMREGAMDYILKPLDSERFLAGIRNAMRLCELQDENANLARQLLTPEVSNPDIFKEMVTGNESMIKIFKYIEAIAPTRHPVLITGETGVGKELIARALHDLSGMSGAFIAVNVAAIDDTVFSDTLFGHAKGAFTGADAPRKGLVEAAAGGTLFLDEIGGLSMNSQTKLLRLLQEKEFLPLGMDTTMHSNARIVAATCRDLTSFDNAESFRRDLFYRLRTHHIAVPPLRSRKDDLEILVSHFAQKAATELGKATPGIPAELFTLLAMYSFPGNVRELQSMVFDAISAQRGNTLSLQSFRERMGMADTSTGEKAPGTAATEPGKKRVAFSDQLPTLAEIEELLVNEALSRTKGNQSMASHLLGITRQALGKRLKNRSRS